MADGLACVCGVSIKVLVVERFEVEVLGCWVICSREEDLEGEEEDEEDEKDEEGEEVEGDEEVEGCPDVGDGEGLVYFLRNPIVERL